VQKRLSAKISLIALFSLLMFLFSATAVRAYNEVFPASRYYRYMQDIYENHNSHYCRKLRILAIASYFRDRNTDLAIKTAKTYATLVERHSRINGVDPFLTASVIVRESNVRRKANNSNRSYGFMQINWPANGSWIRKKYPGIKKPADLYRTENNLKVGTYILGSNLQKYDGNVDRTLDRYRGKSLLFCRKEVLAHYKK